MLGILEWGFMVSVVSASQ